MKHHNGLQFVLACHTIFILCFICMNFSLCTKLHPCGNVRSHYVRLSDTDGDKWFKWAQLYSFCKQFDAATRGINSTFDRDCTTLKCKECLSVCYKDEKDQVLTVCEQSCNSEACKFGCRFYSHIFNKQTFNFTSDLKNAPNLINTVVNGNRSNNSVSFSWTPVGSRGDLKLSSIYLIVIHSNKDGTLKEFVLGLIEDSEYILSTEEMCNNVYAGYKYEVNLQFVLTVYPINFNGPTSAIHAKKLNLSLDSEYTNPLEGSLIQNVTVASGSPFFRTIDDITANAITWKIEWSKPIGSEGVKYTYSVARCGNMRNLKTIRQRNTKKVKEAPLEGPANIVIYNTEDDKLDTCEIHIALRKKHGGCFLGKPSSKLINYTGCASIVGHKCRPQTPPPPPLIDTLVYGIRVDVIGTQCENSTVDTCPINTNLTCSYCNTAVYDIQVNWNHLNISNAIQSYTVRWGNLKHGYIDRQGVTQSSVPANTTSFLISSLLLFDDVTFGVQVHADTSLSIPMWEYVKISIFIQELTIPEPIPIFPPTENDDEEDEMKTIIVVVIVLVFVCFCSITIVLMYIRRLKQNKEHICQYHEENNMNLEKVNSADEWEIHPSNFTVNEKIGEGAFGTVYSATIETQKLIKTKYARQCGGVTLTTDKTKTAIKFLKEGAQDMEYNDFQEEILLMKSIGYHENIVNMIGCNTVTQPLCLIVEFMQHGDLLHHMRTYRTNQLHAQPRDHNHQCDDSPSNVLSTEHIMSFAWQIACGMEYLGIRNVVHRDLAARNILINDQNKVKISDFGLSRYVNDELVYVSSNKSRRLPIKWMSVEAIYHQEFTIASDVWAYGVVLFEIVTLGGTPYPSIENHELCKMLKSGYRMEKPETCDDTIYDVMLHCWNEIPSERPTFTELREHLETIVEKGDLYFTFEIDENKTYYNVASFKSIPSDEEMEVEHAKEYNVSPVRVNSLPIINDMLCGTSKLKPTEESDDSDVNRYFSPHDLKGYLDTEKSCSFDNPNFYRSYKQEI